MISLCIISRKEDSESLGNALRSVQGFVDEIIIVDTGKEPIKVIANGRQKTESHEVFSDFGKVKLVPFKWTNDFAAARNFSFEQATGDVILWIDSDDIVKNPENLPALAKQITDGKCDWIYLEYVYQKDDSGNVLATHWKPRLMRKGTGHWVGNVHEDFTNDSVVKQMQDKEFGVRVVIEHESNEKHRVASAHRNLEIQLEEISRDGDKVDPRTLYYTGLSYQALGNFEEAIKYFLKHIKVSGSKEDKYWSAYRVGLCLHILGRYDEAVTVLLDTLKSAPGWKSSYFAIAAIYSSEEKWAQCIEWTLTGLEKETPDTLQVTSEIDYTILPLGRLAEAYLHTGNYGLALETAQEVYQINPKFPQAKELVEMCKEALELEGFVKSFLNVVNSVRKVDRTKAIQLFDLLPDTLHEDYRIQEMRMLLVPPTNWKEKSIAIFCGTSLEPWAYPSIFQGIGGSEEAVINISQQLSKLGYAVTVYNRCGDMKGEYEGVNYLPYYYFNPKDNFDTLIVWRNQNAFLQKLKAKRKFLWLHDIAWPEQYNEKIYKNVDKILFLSKWHRDNLPDCPEEKVFITNNGINPDDFKKLPKKRPNSLIWASSYDRGLLPFIKNILPLIKEKIPEVTLDVAYGWQNIEKELELIPSLKNLYTELSPILDNTPGITHHGRLSHLDLAKLMGSSMVYPYATEFGETNNITSQKMQAAGVYVLTTPTSGATPERLRLGTVVPVYDIYTSEASQEKFAKAVIAWLTPSDVQKVGINYFSWETTAKQWDKNLL